MKYDLPLLILGLSGIAITITLGLFSNIHWVLIMIGSIVILGVTLYSVHDLAKSNPKEKSASELLKKD